MAHNYSREGYVANPDVHSQLGRAAIIDPTFIVSSGIRPSPASPFGEPPHSRNQCDFSGMGGTGQQFVPEFYSHIDGQPPPLVQPQNHGYQIQRPYNTGFLSGSQFPGHLCATVAASPAAGQVPYPAPGSIYGHVYIPPALNYQHPPFVAPRQGAFTSTHGSRNSMDDTRQFLGELNRRFEYLLNSSMLTIANARAEFRHELNTLIAGSNFTQSFRHFITLILAAGQAGHGDGTTRHPMHPTPSPAGIGGMQTEDRNLPQGHSSIPPNFHQNPTRSSSLMSTCSPVRHIPDAIDAHGPSLHRVPESANAFVATRSTEKLGVRDKKSYADVLQQPSGTSPSPRNGQRGNPSSNPLSTMTVDANGTGSSSLPQGMSRSAVDEHMHTDTSKPRSQPRQRTPYTNDILLASQNLQAKGITPVSNASPLDPFGTTQQSPMHPQNTVISANRSKMKPPVQNSNGSGSQPRLSSSNQRPEVSQSKRAEAQSFGCENSGCPKQFTRLDNMKRHTRTKHGDPIGWTCPICPKKIARSDNAPQHVRLGHGIGDVCPECEFEGGIIAHLQEQSDCVKAIRKRCDKKGKVQY